MHEKRSQLRGPWAGSAGGLSAERVSAAQTPLLSVGLG